MEHNTINGFICCMSLSIRHFNSTFILDNLYISFDKDDEEIINSYDSFVPIKKQSFVTFIQNIQNNVPCEYMLYKIVQGNEDYYTLKYVNNSLFISSIHNPKLYNVNIDNIELASFFNRIYQDLLSKNYKK